MRDRGTEPALAVLILAGGEARRMGGGKPLRALGHQTLLQWSINRAKDWSDQVAIAARSADQIGETGLPVIIDPDDIAGPLAGLASAARMPAARVLTIPCDMPFLPDELPDRLAGALGDRGAALAASGGRVHPVCGLWRTAMLGQLPAFLATGRRSLMGFAEWIGFATVEWSGDAFFNVNSPAELAAAEARLD